MGRHNHIKFKPKKAKGPMVSKTMVTFRGYSVQRRVPLIKDRADSSRRDHEEPEAGPSSQPMEADVMAERPDDEAMGWEDIVPVPKSKVCMPELQKISLLICPGPK